MTTPTFAEIARAYARPDLVAVEAEARGWARACDAAGGGEALLAAARGWNAARLRVDTARQVASVRFQQDTTSVEARAEEDFWNDASPLLRELDALHARTLLASPHRAALDAAFGPQLAALKRCAAATFAPEIKEAIAEEARLCSQYTELCARPEIELRGERLNLTGVARYFALPDRPLRLEAQQARDAFLGRYAGELDGLYDRLVALRDGMGRALGHPGFVPLGYLLMSRTGYGPAEVATFREEVRAEVVPLVAEIFRARARRLGLDKVLYHDEPLADARGNPRPLGGVDFCVARARETYRALGPRFGEFFDRMADGGLLDLDNRPGKAGGGFCTHFATSGTPFIFANFNGTDDDVRVLTHECGHAFQAYRSRGLEPLEYRFPTMEAAEIHSMTMEYLTHPWMGLFFGEEEAPRSVRLHLEQELVMLPYMAAVDHFQHEVYAAPGAAAADRLAMWRWLEATYLPWRDYGGLLPRLEAGGLWQRQLHVYHMPFYYIDYALAQACALQLWRRAEEDRPRALADYLTLCDLGGSRSFSELVAAAGLRSPFEPGCLREVVAHARRALGI